MNAAKRQELFNGLSDATDNVRDDDVFSIFKLQAAASLVLSEFTETHPEAVKEAQSLAGHCVIVPTYEVTKCKDPETAILVSFREGLVRAGEFLLAALDLVVVDDAGVDQYAVREVNE